MPQQMGCQGGPGEESHQDWRSTSDGLIRPLALGLHAQMRPHLLEGDLQLPAQHKPFQDLRRIRRRIGAEQGLGSEFALGVPNQDPTQGYRRLARAVPDRRLRGESQRAGSAVVPGCRHGGPGHGGQVQECLQRWQPPAFQRRPTVLTGLTGWGRFIKGGVQAQAGDEGNGLSQRLAAVEQVQDGVAAVAHQHQGAVGQPAAQLQDHLPSPVGELLVAASALPVVAFRGRQHGKKGQGPIASRPGDMAQPHQGNPAQAAGLDQLLATGTHRVAVDAPSLDLSWTLRISSGVSKGIDKSVVQSGRDFPYIRVGGGQ